MYALPKINAAAFLFFFSLFFFSSSTFLQAETPSGDPSIETQAKLRLMEEQMKRMEGTLHEIIAREDKILEEIDRLRKWMFHKG